MPWFPEFIPAAELGRPQTRAAGQEDPVGQYLAALSSGDARNLETVWLVEVVVFDPRAGEVRGHRQLRRFVRANKSWLAEKHVRTRVVASTYAEGRAVVELLACLNGDAQVGEAQDGDGRNAEAQDGAGRNVEWPVAVVAESRDDRSVVFR